MQTGYSYQEIRSAVEKIDPLGIVDICPPDEYSIENDMIYHLDVISPEKIQEIFIRMFFSEIEENIGERIYQELIAM